MKGAKICFATSSGGHFEQIAMLKPLMDKYPCCVVTEKTRYSASIRGQKMYYLHQVNRREKACFFWLFLNALKSFVIFLKEKPDVIITTGVFAMIPLCLICKMFQRKLIYIESFAKVTSPTKTGKLMYQFADRFYVQWEPMLKFYRTIALVLQNIVQVVILLVTSNLILYLIIQIVTTLALNLS